jgi:hypothetical protein
MSQSFDSSRQTPADEPRRESGRYRFRGGRSIDPSEGVHPEMNDLDQPGPPPRGIPNSPDELIAMQEPMPDRPERPEKPERQQSAKVQQVLDLIKTLDTNAYEDQQIALALVRHLERFHDDVVEELQEDADAKHTQIVSWAVDADRLMRCRHLLESVDLE